MWLVELRSKVFSIAGVHIAVCFGGTTCSHDAVTIVWVIRKDCAPLQLRFFTTRHDVR